MENKNVWEQNAIIVEDAYGCYVDYKDRFYLCPYCGEAIYEEDWSEESLEEFICPICEDEDEEDEEE